MISTHSTQPLVAIALRGHASPVTRSLDVSPEPSATQNRPGNICRQGRDRLGDDRRVVALPGGVDHAERQLVVASAAPRHDQAKPESPCRTLQGEKWSEDMPP